jgi:nicotinate-nucleotide adenylyltransferase
MNEPRNKLGILGGLFDPIHYGHLSLSSHARLQLKLEKVLFVPSYYPPHRREISPYKHRLRMTRIAVENEKYFEASDLESNIKGLSYTVNTLERIKDIYPEYELYFIIGSDNLEKMEEWHKPELIFELAHVVMGERPGEDSTADSPFRDRILKIEMEPVDISSTEIREMVREKKSIDGLVPPKVAEYIVRNKLYVRKDADSR